MRTTIQLPEQKAFFPPRADRLDAIAKRLKGSRRHRKAKGRRK